MATPVEPLSAAAYDAWYETPRGRWIGETEYRLILALLDLRPGATVLDVGCGTGWFTRRLAADGMTVTGLDNDARSLAFARQRCADRITYVEGDACALPFADAAFDAVVSITALCFIEAWPAALAEIVRVSGRRFALGLLNRRSLLWLEKGRGGGRGAYRGAHWHTRAELEAALHGLPVRSAQYRYGVMLPSGGSVAQRLERRLSSSLPFGSFLAVGARVTR